MLQSARRLSVSSRQLTQNKKYPTSLRRRIPARSTLSIFSSDHRQDPHSLLLNHLQDRPFSTHSNHTSYSSSSSSKRLLNQSAYPAAFAATSYDEDEEEDEDINEFVRRGLMHVMPRASYPKRSGSSISRLDLELGQERNRSAAAQEASEEETFAAEEKRDATIAKRQHAIQSDIELLGAFDPHSPPKKEDYPDTDSTLFLEAMQLWLECQAQGESVQKHQDVIDAARKRKDYRSLSLVQKQIARWFPKLNDAIDDMQRKFLMYDNRKSEPVPSLSAFGPFICSLPPAKLAVITAHEALLASLQEASLVKTKTKRRNNATLLKVALKVGDAVEDEVMVHRLLHKRFREAQLAAKNASSSSELSESLEQFDEGTLDVDDFSQTTLERVAVKDDDQLDLIPETSSSKKTGLRGKGKAHKWSYAPSHLKNYMDEFSLGKSKKKGSHFRRAVKRARAILNSEDEWTAKEKAQLGLALVTLLFDTATVQEQNGKAQAFAVETLWERGRQINVVQVNSSLRDKILTDKLVSLSATTDRYKPMIVPPRPWSSVTEGGYRMLKTELMRYHGSVVQREALEVSDGCVLLDGLNALGRVPWKINKRMLELTKRCWDDGIVLGDIPSRTDFEVPAAPIRPDKPEIWPEKGTPAHEVYVTSMKLYAEKLQKYNRVLQKNADLRSLRCSATLKLDQAEQFKDFENLYFPYNIDFRGRAYPVPPHLSNVGSDLCRGLLKFSEKKALGERGLFWLKVHLANFAGKDKMTFEQRAEYVDTHMEQIRQSAENPWAGERWWTELEDPFQGLSTCYEIVAAIDSGDPTTYMCDLPVHMDGSCNGLQHYAALGRDRVGGKAVNLCRTEEPQDVYVSVMDEVIQRVAMESERVLSFDESLELDQLTQKQKKELSNHRSAKLVNGLIDRGVVKRTVMTSVYGVTYIGARNQIQEKIEEKLEAAGHDIDEMEHDMFQACGYLAKVTLHVIGDLFTGAQGTMDWLRTSARMIAQQGHPVAWISPIGLPAIQPYRKDKSASVVTLRQTLNVSLRNDDLPINILRQVSAFPPNYIHSLDSAHMLLTALEMDRRGLAFSAVHDSFWTHPCDVDELNQALREVFVDLYSQPLLERLKETWEIRYPGLEFPDLPKRGNLDLEEVKGATYFFQ